jgi:uncharacterized iron-regulated membrane protein
MTRRVFVLAHRWIGLVVALPMLWQAITGCFLVLTPVWEEMRPTPAITEGQAHSASDILAAASVPGLVPTRYQPAGEHRPAVVEMGVPAQRGAERQLLIDPVSLAVVGTRQPSQVYRWVHSLHENLLVPQYSGRTVVGWFGVGLLLLGLSGVVLWWPVTLRPGRWRAAMTVKKGARGARLQRELHGAVGFWVSVLLIIMSATGIAQAFPQTARGLFGLSNPFQTVRPGGRREGGAREPLDIDAVVARAAEAVPGARLVDVRLPNQPGANVFAQLETPGSVEGAPNIRVTIDPAGHRLMSVQNPNSGSFGEWVLGWMRAVHFGDAFGWPWRALVFLTGFALPTLAVTGSILWWLRRRMRRRVQVQRQAALQEVAE